MASCPVKFFSLSLPGCRRIGIALCACTVNVRNSSPQQKPHEMKPDLEKKVTPKSSSD